MAEVNRSLSAARFSSTVLCLSRTTSESSSEAAATSGFRLTLKASPGRRRAA
ncbi:Uncharacterised protein [Acinetobacter baumannii]|nr:Uncharacterised protein [Acinetobacter baumannii]